MCPDGTICMLLLNTKVFISINLVSNNVPKNLEWNLLQKDPVDAFVGLWDSRWKADTRLMPIPSYAPDQQDTRAHEEFQE